MSLDTRRGAATRRRKRLLSRLARLLCDLWFLLRYTAYLMGKPRPARPCDSVLVRSQPGSRISVIMPCYGTRPGWFWEAVDSVRSQDYPNWELCIGMCSMLPSVLDAARAIADTDPRIRLVDIPQNRGISGNSNLSASGATGDYVSLLDHDDVLRPGALSAFSVVCRGGEYGLVYSDEDRIGGIPVVRYRPFCKPDYAPDTILSQNYFCHFTAVRRDLFELVRGFREEVEGAQDYDLFLRCLAKGAKVAHVRSCLYSWRVHKGSSSSGIQLAKPYASKAQIDAVAGFCSDNRSVVGVERGLRDGIVRVRYAVPEALRVKIVVYHDGGLSRLETRTGGTEDFGPRLLRHAQGEHTDVVRIRCEGNLPATFSGILSGSTSDVVVFLHQNTCPCTDDWLAPLVEHAARSEIAAVGCTINGSDNIPLHTGISLWKGLDCPTHEALYKQHHGTMSQQMFVTANTTAVSHLCFALSRTSFTELGGFCKELPTLFLVDYCLRAYESGMRVVYAPHSLHRIIAGSPKTPFGDDECERFRQRWRHRLGHDRFYDPYYLKSGSAE